MPEFDPRPITLELPGGRARLVPMTDAHAPGLLSALGDGSLWRYLPGAAPTDLGSMRAWIAEVQRRHATGTEVPFTVLDRHAPGPDGSARVVGSTRYIDIQRGERGLEIGWTWLGAEARRTSLNTECKLLLLTHAFEGLGAIRVQLKMDARNTPSIEAVERLGARYEGRLRQHRILPDGYFRDTLMFSLIDREWPEAKARLLERLARGPVSGVRGT